MELTYEDAIISYLKYVKLKLKRQSYRSVENRVNNYILPYFKGENIYDLKWERYVQWQTDINELGFTIGYKQTLHTCFVTFINHCMKFYNVKVNIASLVGNFKNDGIELRGNIWDYNEFKQFIGVVDDLIYNTLFKFLFFTGVRIGEALALTFDDLEDNYIYINKNMTRFVENHKRVINSPKTKKSTRNIRIDDVTKNELLNLQNYYITKYNSYNSSFYIFGGNRAISMTTLTRKKNNYCSLANVKQITIHEFRHSHSCLLYDYNVPIKDISNRLGHAKTSTTVDIYLRYRKPKEKRVIETLSLLRAS